MVENRKHYFQEQKKRSHSQERVHSGSDLESIAKTSDTETQNTDARDRTYEKYAVILDTVGTLGLGIATHHETSPLQYLLGFGTFCSGLGVVAGSPKTDDSTIKFMQKIQPVLGTMAAFCAGGYFFMGDVRSGTVMAGLGAACYARTFSQFFRSKKKADGKMGLVGLLDKEDSEQ